MTQPTLTREGIAAALFALVQSLPGLVTTSRRLRMWTDVDPADQPAAFLAMANQSPSQDPDGLPTQWHLKFTVSLYAHNTDPATAPSTVINNLLDALEVAIKPVQFGMPGFPGSVQVLGDTTGRIRHAWISGEVETDEGVLGDQAIAIVPIAIAVVPAAPRRPRRRCGQSNGTNCRPTSSRALTIATPSCSTSRSSRCGHHESPQSG